MSTSAELMAQVAPEQTAPAVPIREQTLAQVISGDTFKKQLALALPKTMTADRMSRIVLTEIKRTPALAKCSPASFYGAVLQCAQLGLEPGSALGQAYLLPFGNGKDSNGRANCQLIIGYRGMIDLARRSGQIQSLNAYPVYEKDEFTYELGLHPDIKHKPSPEADRGALLYVYAVANLTGGGVQFEVMSRPEIEKVRNASKAGKSGPWVSHFEEMAKKTVIRRLFKYLPVSIEAFRAVEVDEKADRGEAVTEQDVWDAEFIDHGVEH